MQINSSIFKAYDIRGIYPSELDEKTTYLIGKAISDIYKPKKVLITRDCRLSSPSLFESLKKSFLEEGINVISIGITPTPQMYFSHNLLDSDFSIAISASHNPKEYNGLKLYRGKRNLFPEEIKEIGRVTTRLNTEAIKKELKNKDAKYEEINTDNEYINNNIKGIRIRKRLKVIVDAGNGVGGILAEQILNKLGIENKVIFRDPDGNFPNHHPDPLKQENTKILREKVLKEKADLGVALDGDADRVVFIDEKGNYVNGDVMLGILSTEFLKQKPYIVTEVKASKSLIDFIEEKGGKPIIYKVGRTNIETKFKELNAPIAGELSGHYFYRENGYDDALYTMIRLIKILSDSTKKLSEMVEEFPKYLTTPEIRIKVEEKDKFRIVEELIEDFKKEYEVLDVDGARVNFPYGWGLVRASNTEPALTLRFEADTKENLDNIKEIFKRKLKAKGVLF